MGRRSAQLTAVVAVVLLALSVTVPGAQAHQVHEGSVVVVDGVEPPLPGVRVGVVTGGIGKLYVEADGVTVTVLGDGDQPLFRVGPAGVEANAAAPGWYQVNEPLGIAPLPAEASRSTPPSWVTVAVGSRWEWFDHRLHPGGTEVTDWSIPIDVDGERASITGSERTLSTHLVLALDAASVPDGLEVTVIEQPTLALRLRSSVAGPVQVLGAGGEVFAQVTGEQVLLNRRSPTWTSAAQVAGRDLLGAVVDAAAPPDLVSAGPSADLIWPDPRLAPATPEGSADWAIPVVLEPGAAPVLLQGTTRSVAIPVDHGHEADGDGGGFPTVPVAIAAAATLALGGVVLVTRRR